MNGEEENISKLNLGTCLNLGRECCFMNIFVFVFGRTYMLHTYIIYVYVFVPNTHTNTIHAHTNTLSLHAHTHIAHKLQLQITHTYKYIHTLQLLTNTIRTYTLTHKYKDKCVHTLNTISSSFPKPQFTCIRPYSHTNAMCL